MANKTEKPARQDKPTVNKPIVKKDENQILDTVTALADAAKTLGQGVAESLEHTVAKEKARITKEEGSADLEKVVDNYTKRVKSGVREFLAHPGATIGKAMLKGSAKVTGSVAKASGRSIGCVVTRKAGAIAKAIKEKPEAYLERELAQRELKEMSDVEKIYLATSYAGAKKAKIIVEAGKTLFGKARKWVQSQFMSKTYKTFLPGSDILVAKALQYYYGDSDNMTLDGEVSGIKYKVSTRTINEAAGKNKSFAVNTHYNARADQGVESVDVLLNITYDSLNQKKDKESMKKELDSLVQQAIRDMDAVESLREVNQEGQVRLITDDQEAKGLAYTYKLEKTATPVRAPRKSVINLVYNPKENTSPILTVSYSVSIQSRPRPDAKIPEQ